jgi:hypothetical protein
MDLPFGFNSIGAPAAHRTGIVISKGRSRTMRRRKSSENGARSGHNHKNRRVGTAVDFAVQALERRVLLSGLTPAQVRDAYGINSVSFNGTPADGRGQTVAIVIPYNYDTAFLDANAFSTQYDDGNTTDQSPLPQFSNQFAYVPELNTCAATLNTAAAALQTDSQALATDLGAITPGTGGGGSAIPNLVGTFNGTGTQTAGSHVGQSTTVKLVITTEGAVNGASAVNIPSV